MAQRTADVAEVSWPEFLDYFAANWRQGEHVALVGPTGSGKSNLMRQLLPLRKWVAIFATKPKDSTLEGFSREGFTKIKKWPPKRGVERVILWPPMRRFVDTHSQANEFGRAFDEIFTAGAWCIALDELRYVIDNLGLKREVVTLWLQGRSLGISMVCATQRPAMVPLEMYDQSTHLFFWRDNDERNLKRLSGISWLSSDTIRTQVANLPHHAVLYVNTRTGELVQTKPERA